MDEITPSLTDVELTKAIAAFLGEIDGWAWRPDGPVYTDTEVGVDYGAIQADTNRRVGVRVYMTTDEQHLAVRRIQLRSRGAPGDPTGADELADAAFARLQGLSRVGGISGVSRLSMAPLGADANRREERTDNYIITLDNQEALS
ncbi:minor capsid protein [Agromyces sp. NPDC058064]|uniref:phage tail terminator protein n=1 Tax=Agromyces sp. NPDC058064 TaxID=3346322 RepID=UPI0036DEFEF8